jgi:predicted dehydrogenase
LKKTAPARIVAVCDVDHFRAVHAKRVAEETYAQHLPGERPANIEVFNDYRELLARDDIDGITISTPDHWHALIAIAAAEAGKHVYLQKPLTYTIAEGRKLINAVRKNRVILKVGSQQRSNANFRRACELVRNGRVGRLPTIEVRLPADSGTGDATPMAVPKNLDYERWLGPTSEVPYTQDRVHPQDGFGRPGWLQIELYSRGMITAWGSHMFDIAQWGHGSDDTGPVEMKATAEFPNRGLFNVHTTFHAEAQYADDVRLLAKTSPLAGVRFAGDQGWIDVGRTHLTAQPTAILEQPLDRGDQLLARSDQHMLNFLQSIHSHQDPICSVEVGHRSNSICVITHIAMKLGASCAGTHWANDSATTRRRTVCWTTRIVNCGPSSWRVTMNISWIPLIAATGGCDPVCSPDIQLSRDDNAGKLAVLVDGREVMAYLYGPEDPLSHYWPLRSPSGRLLTVQHAEPYPHHRSLWIADHVQAESSTAVDFYHCWKNYRTANRPESGFRHFIRHDRFGTIEASGHRAMIEAELRWIVDEARPVLDEHRTLQVVALGGGEYFVDLVWELRSSYGSIKFMSDPVHNAWPYIRMNPQFHGEHGGKIISDTGAMGQLGTGGRTARWIDYSNTIDGVTEGLARMVHPESDLPRKWLTREYGTFGPRRPKQLSGTLFTLRTGERLNGRVWILIHRGDASSDHVAQRYQQYVEGQRK